MKQHDPAHLISIARLHVENGTEVSILRLRGAVAGCTQAEFRERLGAAAERSPYVVVNLHELEYLSAEGVGILLEQSNLQDRRGGWLRLVDPSRTVSDILMLSGAGGALAPLPSEDDAVREMAARAA